jgi:hypothetical protein
MADEKTPEKGADKKKAIADEATVPKTVCIRNAHHARVSYTFSDGPLNPGPKVEFDDVKGHEHEVTEEQAKILLAKKYTFIHDSGRQEEKPRFVEVKKKAA